MALARFFREKDKTLESFDMDFNMKMNRKLVFDLATARFVVQREDALFLGPPGAGKSHLAQAIGVAAIHQGHKAARPDRFWCAVTTTAGPNWCDVCLAWTCLLARAAAAK